MTDSPFELKPLTVRAAMGRSVVALGSFDGMHRGHGAIIEAARELAERLTASLCVFSFSLPPASYAQPQKRILLSDTNERLHRFGALGADLVIFADFEELRDMSAEDFVKNVLIGRLGAAATVCGFNFCFGKDRGGSPALLARHFGENAVCVNAVMHGGAPISSSRIRALLEKGEVEEASRLLGAPYSVTLPVLRGRGDGKRLGFPTLNQIPPQNRLMPKFGVYATRTTLPDGRHVPSVSDCGVAPTLDASGVARIETHLLDTSSELYGRSVKVEFLARLRDEAVFPDADALARQIDEDISCARAIFDKIQHTGT